MDLRNLKELYKSVKTTLDVKGLSAGFENINLTDRESVRDIESKLDTGLAMAYTSISGVEIKRHQLEAARQAALMALGNISSIVNARKAIREIVPEPGFETISINSLPYVRDSLTTGYEAFSSKATTPLVTFTALFNTAAIVQDPVVELFFPVINIDPMSPGATVRVLVDTIMKQFNRGVDGNEQKATMFKKALTKALVDKKLMSEDANRLVPVVRTQNEHNFVPNIRYTVDYNGENVTTGPLVLGKIINLLGISQTDEMLAKGVMDQTDSLDPAVRVSTLFFKLTGTVNNQNVTEYFKFDLSQLNVGYTYNPQQHNKDIVLNYTGKPITIKIGTTRTYNGATSQILAGLNANNYTITLRLFMTGNGNTQTGDIETYVAKVEIAEIRDASNNVVPTTDTMYTTIKNAFDNFTAVGIEYEAYATNENLRFARLIGTTDGYAAVYNIPIRSGINIQTPVAVVGNDGDLQYLNTQINISRQKLNYNGLTTLFQAAEFLKTAREVDNTFIGLGTHILDKWYHEETISLSSIVDSISSADRNQEIEKALINKINMLAVNAYIESKYAFAMSTLKPGVKPTVIVGTDPLLGSFIANSQLLNTNEIFNYEVRVSPLPEMRNIIFFSFGIFEDRNSEPNILNFGQCFWQPEVVVSTVRTVNNSTRNELIVMPRYLHVINIPILCKLVVTDIELALGKIAVNFKQVQ